ncbi:acyl-CoA dehydrogenase family protein, partial [Frankia sp. R43]|uniref:acyl-CoA dehydrogenase family protein n=1 Tax=Frankia sp. R43 TaxID=269536 RepID=UPI0021014091
AASSVRLQPGLTAPSTNDVDRTPHHIFTLSRVAPPGAMTDCKDRVAFGRPIGSFQAIKHQLADSSLALEMSHAVVTAAARAIATQDRGPVEAARAAHAASLAKAFVSDAAIELAHNCWQHFGGISYTWEHDFHLYLRRLTADAALYGTPTWHRERVCQLSGV